MRGGGGITGDTLKFPSHEFVVHIFSFNIPKTNKQKLGKYSETLRIVSSGAKLLLVSGRVTSQVTANTTGKSRQKQKILSFQSMFLLVQKTWVKSCEISKVAISHRPSRVLTWERTTKREFTNLSHQKASQNMMKYCNLCHLLST